MEHEAQVLENCRFGQIVRVYMSRVRRLAIEDHHLRLCWTNGETKVLMGGSGYACHREVAAAPLQTRK